MNEENNTSAAFREIILKKVETQEKKFTALEEKVNNTPDNTELIQMLISNVDGLRNDVHNSRFPAEKLQDLSSRLDLIINLHKQSVKKEIYHHHHIPKIILISIGLFIALTWVCSGWYITSGKLNDYIANDTKYRQLRLDTSLRSLQHYLDRIDSLYDARPDMRKIVLETEEKNRENFERKEKANWLREEAKDLEREAQKK